MNEGRIGVSISSPIWNGGAFGERSFVNLTSYTDTNNADGGYESASFSMAINREEFSWILTHVLGADVEAINPNTETRWEGFVNNVTLNFGRLGVTLGPFLDIQNRVRIQYQDFTTGVSTITDNYNSTQSQELYGIRSLVVNSGEMSSTNAEKIAYGHLEEYGYPKHINTFNAGNTEFSATIDCLGYVYLLEYPYYNSASTTTTVSEKIASVIGGEPNSVISSNVNSFEDNNLSVYDTETDYKSGRSIIKDLVGLGGENDNYRRLFGIGQGRIAYYKKQPRTIDYIQSVDNNDGLVRTSDNGAVQEWQLEPGKWIEFTGILIGEDLPLGRDPSKMFIETVSFQMPDQVSINGGEFGRLRQRLNKLGLGGV